MQGLSVGRDANAGPLSEREWMFIDQRINWWMQENMTALNLLDVTRVGEGKMSIEYSAFNDVGAPILTYSYQEEGMVKLDKTPTRANLIGLRIDFEVAKIEVDVNGSYLNQCVDAGMRKMQQYIDRIVFRGSDVNGLAPENGVGPAVNGLFNYTSVQSLGGGGSGIGGDDDMTAPGDYPHTVNHMISKEVSAFFYGPYDLVMTPGSYQQAIANESTTTGLKDLESILRIPAPQAVIQANAPIPSAVRRIITTPNLLNTTEVNAAGEMMLLDNKPENMDLLVNYEPTRINLFGGGLTPRLTQQFCMIAGLAARVRRVNAVCITVTLTNNVLSA